MLKNTSRKKGLILNFSARIIVSAAICIMMIMANGDRAVAAEGDTGWYGNFGYEELSDGTLEITYCSLEDGVTSISVPETIKGKKVTQIGYGVFQLQEELKSIKLPSGITQISDNAFLHCKHLESITLPSGLKKIGNSAFYGCRRLTKIALQHL